jgi:hypothetical protein
MPPGTRSYKEDVGVLIVPNNINLRLHDPEGDGQCVWLKSTKVSANHNWNETNVRAGNLATFVTVPQTFNGSDAAGARYLTYKKPCSGFCLNDDYVKVKVDEEGSNGETSHKTETLGILTADWKSCVPDVVK